MSDDFIATRGSTKTECMIDFKSITYESHKPKHHNMKNISDQNTRVITTNEFNIKKAKHEIVKFGMSGFDSQKKEEAKIQLAIKLGAKPPKNKYKNYKLVQEERKKQKETQEKEKKFQQLGKNTIGKSIAKGKAFDRKRRMNKNGILEVYGKVKL